VPTSRMHAWRIRADIGGRLPGTPGSWGPGAAPRMGAGIFFECSTALRFAPADEYVTEIVAVEKSGDVMRALELFTEVGGWVQARTPGTTRMMAAAAAPHRDGFACRPVHA